MARVYSTEYAALHARLRRTRGRAKTHKCHDCGSQANEWSQIHDTDGTDIRNHYVPRCYSCHKQYDETGYQAGHTHSSEVREKLRQSRKRVIVSEETRRKLSKAHKGKPLPATHRKKISESKKKTPPKWCDECEKSWPPGTWARHIRKYHEGGKW